MWVDFRLKVQMHRALFCSAISCGCLTEAGCESVVDDAVRQSEYNDQENYYKSRGTSDKKGGAGAFFERSRLIQI